MGYHSIWIRKARLAISSVMLLCLLLHFTKSFLCSAANSLDPSIHHSRRFGLSGRNSGKMRNSLETADVMIFDVHKKMRHSKPFQVVTRNTGSTKGACWTPANTENEKPCTRCQQNGVCVSSEPCMYTLAILSSGTHYSFPLSLLNPSEFVTDTNGTLL